MSNVRSPSRFISGAGRIPIRRNTGSGLSIPYRPNLNIISCLMEIQKNPVTREGKPTTPPVWSMNCLEQVCGICTMVINGRVRQSCSALIDNLEQPIKLEPMSKFPNVRDLVVDRSQMFDHLKRVHAWIELDGTHDLGPGPRMDQEDVQERYAYSRCMTCGCCLEACPQYDGDNYIGPQAIAQVRLFNMHPTGKMTRDERLEALHGGRRHHQLRQRAELRAGLPDEYPAHQSDLRRKPRDRSPRLVRLAKKIEL